VIITLFLLLIFFVLIVKYAEVTFIFPTDKARRVNNDKLNGRQKSEVYSEMIG
jgi:hypothetical protein